MISEEACAVLRFRVSLTADSFKAQYVYLQYSESLLHSLNFVRQR